MFNKIREKVAERKVNYGETKALEACSKIDAILAKKDDAGYKYENYAADLYDLNVTIIESLFGAHSQRSTEVVDGKTQLHLQLKLDEKPADLNSVSVIQTAVLTLRDYDAKRREEEMKAGNKNIIMPVAFAFSKGTLKEVMSVLLDGPSPAILGFFDIGAIGTLAYVSKKIHTSRRNKKILVVVGVVVVAVGAVGVVAAIKNHKDKDDECAPENDPLLDDVDNVGDTDIDDIDDDVDVDDDIDTDTEDDDIE